MTSEWEMEFCSACLHWISLPLVVLVHNVERIINFSHAFPYSHIQLYFFLVIWYSYSQQRWLTILESRILDNFSHPFLIVAKGVPQTEDLAWPDYRKSGISTHSVAVIVIILLAIIFLSLSIAVFGKCDLEPAKHMPQRVTKRHQTQFRIFTYTIVFTSHFFSSHASNYFIDFKRCTHEHKYRLKHLHRLCSCEISKQTKK